MPKSEFLTAADLFAGAGGLSLGARKAGFHLAVAVEVDSRITPTYRKNHPGVLVLEKDVRELSGDELIGASPSGRIDLLMGCAPCQGFCPLTTKNRREDPRNALVKEMARLVEETLPTAVVMENVPGLAIRGNRLFGAFIRKLKKAGYTTAWWNVQMADYGVPQRRRRLVLLAGRGFKMDLPSPTHARIARNGRRQWRTLRQAIYGERAPKRLSTASPRAENWHVVRDLSPQTRARLQAAGRVCQVVEKFRRVIIRL